MYPVAHVILASLTQTAFSLPAREHNYLQHKHMVNYFQKICLQFFAFSSTFCFRKTTQIFPV